MVGIWSRHKPVDEFAGTIGSILLRPMQVFERDDKRAKATIYLDRSLLDGHAVRKNWRDQDTGLARTAVPERWKRRPDRVFRRG